MGIIATVAAVVGAGAAVYGTVQQAKASKRAARAQRASNAAQERQQQLQARRSRRGAIRRAQIARAQAVSSAQSAGGMGGSGAAGGIGSLSSRTGSALGFSTQMSGLSGLVTDARDAAASAQSDANRFGAIAGFGKTAFGLGMQFGAFGTGQAPNRPPQTPIPTSSSPSFSPGSGGLY